MLTTSMPYDTRRSNATFISFHQYWAESIQFLPLPFICLKSFLILSSHLSLGFPLKICKALLPSSIQDTFPVCLNILDLITLAVLGERYKLWSSSLWNLLYPFSSHLAANIFSRINVRIILKVIYVSSFEFIKCHVWNVFRVSSSCSILHI